MPKYAVIVVDMLNDFITGPISTERALNIIDPNKKLIDKAHERGIPVLYANDCHTADIDYEFTVWGPHAVAGTEGAAVIEQLAPTDKDYIVPKKRYSAFFDTSMDSLLRELDADTVIITGWQCDCCCRHTAADAFFRGYKIVVPEETTDTDTLEHYLDGLDYFKRIYGADVCKLDDLLEKL